LYEDHLDAGSSSWSGFGDMGGTWPQDATEFVDSSGIVHLFAVGTTGNLYEKTLTGSTWSGWADLGGSNQGVPAAVQDSSGTIRVFVRGGKGAVWEDDLPPGGHWSGLASRGGDWPYNPSALVTSGGYVWVFAIAGTGGLYGDELAPGGGWSGWQQIGGPSSNTGVPAAVQDHSGTIRVFVRGADREGLWEADQPRGGSWSTSLASRGGTWPGDASALVTTGGYVWVFGIGTTGSLYGDELAPGGGWSGWNQLGGASSNAGAPAAVQDHNGNIRVFVRGAGADGIWEEYEPPGGSWAVGLASLGFTTF
jgi:hypothetical protein